MVEAQFNPEVRELVQHLTARNIASSEQPDMLPSRYGGKIYRGEPLAGTNPYYPLYHPDLAMNVHSGGARLGHPHPLASRRGRRGAGFWGDMGNMAKGIVSNKGVQDLALKTAENYLLGKGRPVRRRVARRRGPAVGGGFWGDVGNLAKGVASNKAVQDFALKQAENYLLGKGRPHPIASRRRSRRGAGFWKDFGKGMATGASQALKVITPVASVMAPEFAIPLALATAGASELDKKYGIGSGRRHPVAHMVKHRRGGSESGGARGARAQIVKQVMQQHGLSLPQASSFVKQHGLY
jgi:hypothetical protein